MTHDRPTPAVSADDWLATVQRLLAGNESTVPLDAAERIGLLDLARVAAHTSERTSAPLTTYLVGLALASVPHTERAARIAALVRRLEESF
ncbi:MAG: DUF6457 domain-containing protein [Aeromicrobium sp.]